MLCSIRLCARVRWLNSSAGILLVLLQRVPVLRAVVTLESTLVAPAASVLRAILPAAAALSAVDAMAGATTQLVASVSQPARATVGTPFVEAVVIQGLGVSFAQSWAIGNTLPPGVAAQGATLQNGRLAINSSSGTLLFTGTPTTAGTYNVSVSGYQFINLTGPVTTATAQIIVAPAPNAPPVLTRQPANVTTVAGDSIGLSVGFTGTPAPTFQWLKNGVAISGATSATLSLSSVTPADAGNYSVTLTNSLGTITSSSATVTVNPAPAPPEFTVVPAAQSVTAGGTLTLTVAVTGVPTPSVQWVKDGTSLDGATDPTLTLPNVQASDAGVYAVIAANSAGSAVSATATVVVNPAAAPPVFASPPLAQTVSAGGTVVFFAPAIGVPAPSFQWQRDGAAVANANGPTLLLTGVTAASAGNYTCVATNALGVASSPPAALTVSSTADVGRLSNLSILTDISAAAPSFTIGTVIGGSGTSGTKPLLIRAGGPALGALGVPGTIADPRLDVLAGQTVVASNDNWNGTAALSSAFAQVGAFAYADPVSKDAAIFNPTLAARDYTVQVSGVGGATGTVIAELYDATPAGTFTTATPRLVNVSVLKQIPAGGSLTAGFVIGGATAKTVLIRAIGPGLAAVGVASGFLADPQLTLFDGASVAIRSNNNWGGDAALTAAATRAGAFLIANGASQDAMILITLPPGNYTATASGVGGAGGLALIEIYEVP